MNTTKYLLIQKNGTLRIVSKSNSAKPGEISVQLSVSVPYWDMPNFSANVTLPEKTEEEDIVT